MSKRNKQKSKQRKKGKGQSFSGSRLGSFNARQLDMTQFALQAGALLEAGKADEALELLEPLLETNPRSIELLGMAAVAYSLLGDIWSAIASLEQVQRIHPNPLIWETLAGFYLQAGMNAYALQAARNALKVVEDPDDTVALLAMVTTLEHEFEEVVQSTGVSAKQVETGLRHHDDAHRAASQMDFQAAIDANRRAIRLLGNWPRVHNNLAQALFYQGQPAEAMATTQNVLACDPNNLHALSNAIKFLAWSSKPLEAQSLWDRLRLVQPQNDLDRLKQAEAAAMLEKDESVYQLLKPLVDAGLDPDDFLDWQTLYRFAVAEANTGRTKSALNHLKKLDENDPLVQPIVEALKAKRPGIGWATRYSYFSFPELMLMSSFEKMGTLMDQREELDERQFRKRMDRFVEQYPQLILIGRKFIWELQQPDFGIDLLDTIGTPEAYDALREFGLGQVGEDQDRMQALIRLKEAGKLDPDQPVRMWSGGEWREVKLISQEINNEPEIIYPPTVLKLYERALAANRRGEYAEAERLFKQIIVLEPRAADAYFNLGTVYILQDDMQQGIAMYHKALEIRPLYALPRCQLAHFLLNDDDVEGAKAMLLPLVDATRLNELEMTHYLYTQARILMFEKEYEQARTILESLLKFSPNFDPAQELLVKVNLLAAMGTDRTGFWGNMRRRQEKKRSTLRTKFKTPDVTVDMALGAYTREEQGSMAHTIIRGGGWSALKKKQLHERLVEELPDRYTLEQIVQGLSDQERAALRAVVTRGGTMAWDEFDQQYGNDLEESPYWQYHQPTTLMGRLRQHALLTEATVKDQSLVVIPVELRQPLAEIL